MHDSQHIGMVGDQRTIEPVRLLEDGVELACCRLVQLLRVQHQLRHKREEKIKDAILFFNSFIDLEGQALRGRGVTVAPVQRNFQQVFKGQLRASRLMATTMLPNAAQASARDPLGCSERSTEVSTIQLPVMLELVCEYTLMVFSVDTTSRAPPMG